MKKIISGLYLITAICGLIDAVCFLALGGVFAEIMTGNLLFLAFSIGSGHDTEELSKFIVPIVAFILGAIMGGRLLAGPDKAKDRRIGFLIEYVFIVSATIISIVYTPTPDNFSGQVIIFLLAMSMGLQNALIRYHGVPDLATNVMTLTFTGLISESKIAGWDNRRWKRRFISISLFILSAIAGGFLLRYHISLPLILSSLIFSIALYPLIKGSRPE